MCLCCSFVVALGGAYALFPQLAFVVALIVVMHMLTFWVCLCCSFVAALGRAYAPFPQLTVVTVLIWVMYLGDVHVDILGGCVSVAPLWLHWGRLMHASCTHLCLFLLRNLDILSVWMHCNAVAHYIHILKQYNAVVQCNHTVHQHSTVILYSDTIQYITIVQYNTIQCGSTAIKHNDTVQ